MGVFRYLFFELVVLISMVHVLTVINKYQVGQAKSRHGKLGLSSIKDMLHLQLVFSVGLAFLMVLESRVMSKVSTIIGNQVYSKSLDGATTKPISWYNRSHSALIAHKYNHVPLSPHRTTSRFSTQ